MRSLDSRRTWLYVCTIIYAHFIHKTTVPISDPVTVNKGLNWQIRSIARVWWLSSQIGQASVELLIFHISQEKELKGVRANLMSKTMKWPDTFFERTARYVGSVGTTHMTGVDLSGLNGRSNLRSSSCGTRASSALVFVWMVSQWLVCTYCAFCVLELIDIFD